MSWVKFSIFTLGLMLCASQATAAKITQSTDNEGIVHITNSGPDDHAQPTLQNIPPRSQSVHESYRLSHVAAAAHPALSVSKA